MDAPRARWPATPASAERLGAAEASRISHPSPRALRLLMTAPFRARERRQVRSRLTPRHHHGALHVRVERADVWVGARVGEGVGEGPRLHHLAGEAVTDDVVGDVVVEHPGDRRSRFHSQPILVERHAAHQNGRVSRHRPGVDRLRRGGGHWWAASGERRNGNRGEGHSKNDLGCVVVHVSIIGRQWSLIHRGCAAGRWGMARRAPRCRPRCASREVKG